MATATAPSFTGEQYRRSRETYGNVDSLTDKFYMGYEDVRATDQENSARSIGEQIDDSVGDADQYDTEEQAPSTDAIYAAKTLISGVHIPRQIRPEVSVYYGELDVTWRSSDKLVRLIVYSDDRTPKIYSQRDSDNVLSRGQLLDANQNLLNEKLNWLLSQT